jgi:hypothetical protein
MSGYADGLIVKRVVPRFYYRGKGYQNLKQACRAKAKRMLVEMVLGPYEEEVHTYKSFGRTYTFSTWNLKHGCAGEQDGKAKRDARFSKFFPHIGGTLATGCCDMDVDPQTCAREWDDNWKDDAGDFTFESCRYAQRLWIDDMAAQLMIAYQGGLEQ